MARVQHVEEEGELAGQAGLAGAEVVQDDHSQLLREVEHLQGAGRRRQEEEGIRRMHGCMDAWQGCMGQDNQRKK